MKSISPALQAHYDRGSTTLARLWRITRSDEITFGFTDHDAVIRHAGQRYEPSSVFDSSAISTKAELNVDNLTATGLLDSAGITAADIEAGLWDGAAFRIVEVNYADLSMGENVLRVGEFGTVQRKQGQYVVEMRGLMQRLQNTIGRLITPGCDAELGDARCKVDLEALRVSAVATTVASQRGFTAPALTQAEGYFDFGIVTFTSGENDGLRMEVKRHEAGGVFTLQLQMPYPIAPGDAFSVVPGCNKVHQVVDGVVTGDCKNKFNNVLNFRGFDAVPGQDKILLVGGQ